MTETVGGAGGAIGLNKDGNVGVFFNTQCMSWAYISGVDSETVHYGYFAGEHLKTAL